MIKILNVNLKHLVVWDTTSDNYDNIFLKLKNRPMNYDFKFVNYWVSFDFLWKIKNLKTFVKLCLI